MAVKMVAEISEEVTQQVAAKMVAEEEAMMG